ncbi:hypothetical protein Fcan01_16417 [Folsomia candida]|uniref:Uncharacterized protein n=1 Tax=Folsomia candida TaxID=158441 RepID=A0A226DSZ7_FOLCA|nr:hypothetical protein Fcan01_16417 [Folsomia candida]
MLTILFVQKFSETLKTGRFFSHPLIWDDKRGKLCVSQWHHANEWRCRNIQLLVSRVLCLDRLFNWGLGVNFIINVLPFIIFSHFLIFPGHPVHFPNNYPPSSYPFLLIFFAYPPILIFGLVHYAFLMKTVFQAYTGLILLILPLIRDELRPATWGIRCSTKLNNHPADVAVEY